jgi:multidrug efflux pump subunit AcrA (membrane-fusion protein)
LAGIFSVYHKKYHCPPSRLFLSDPFKPAEQGTMYIVNRKALQTPLLLGLLVAVIGCNPKNEYEPPPPPEVTVAHPVIRAITPFFEENGVIEAVEEAEVRSRVSGFVEGIEFDPGEEVAIGKVLYKIEPDRYEARVNSAMAAVAAAEASIAVAEAAVKTSDAEALNAKQDLDREKQLFERGAGSQTDVDAAVAVDARAKAMVDAAKASVQAADAEKGSAEAQLADANLDLGYTTVRAEIGGRITKTNVKLGNLVADGGQLTSIVNRDFVYANFSVSDRQMLRFQKAKLAELDAVEKVERSDWHETPVYLKRETDQGFPFAGNLDYIDQGGVQASTGTLGLRAIFKNENEHLIQGLFVTVRVPIGEPKDGLLVPEYAILRDPRGIFALTVNDEQKIERVDVVVSFHGYPFGRQCSVNARWRI